MERGLYGTIIVENPDDPDYSQDKVVVLDDWRITQAGYLDEDFSNLNDITHDGRWGNVITVNGYIQPGIGLKQNERVRLRFVNTSNARTYSLDFDSLAVMAIAVDGILVREPFDPNGFELAPGNRIDVDITAPKLTEKLAIKDTFTRNTNTLFTVSVSEEVSDDLSFDYPQANNYPRIDSTEYVVDQEYKLDQGGKMHNFTATINGESYPNYSATELTSEKFQVIRFSNSSARLHPMHLHGQFFKVIARTGQSVDEPFMRDTVLVHSNEVVDVGVLPLDRGLWALHCHALEHADAGMMTVVEVI